MKKILTLLLLVVATVAVNAQAPPEAFNYSAVARDANSNPIANSTIGIQISIKVGSPLGATVYQENHFVNTDDFGLFNLIVGGGSILSGTIADIDWSLDDYYLQVGMDASGGTNFLNMGSTQLLSVPYALYAKSAGSVSGSTGFSGDYNDLTNTPSNVSEFNNDAGYVTQADLSTVATTGDYNDLTNQPVTISSISNDGDTLYLSNGETFINGSGGQSGNLVLPTITTNAVTGITSNSATFGGAVSNANGNQIMERGIVYSTTPNPTIGSGKIVIGDGIGAFDTISALGYPYPHLLNFNTTYYVRAYAVTENNIFAYGNEVSFTTLSVGQAGPGGGIVFFDKGNTIGGWQYLETAASDQSTGIEWGCDGTLISGTQLTVGSGEANTALIVSGCNEASFAAQLCNDLTLGGQSDWFLPSRDELNLMYRNLHVNNQGNFNISAYYWSSTEFNAYYAWNFAFDPGPDGNNSKYSTYYVRAVRAF
ncbi:DUF1566 domain-containing protein [Flavobacteriales bacterium]|nr:DUF1566 domain-containing protein [Flavobacteriales bacterium]